MDDDENSVEQLEERQENDDDVSDEEHNGDANISYDDDDGSDGGGQEENGGDNNDISDYRNDGDGNQRYRNVSESNEHNMDDDNDDEDGEYSEEEEYDDDSPRREMTSSSTSHFNDQSLNNNNDEQTTMYTTAEQSAAEESRMSGDDDLDNKEQLEEELHQELQEFDEENNKPGTGSRHSVASSGIDEEMMKEREDLIWQYARAMEERNVLRRKSQLYTRRLSEHFKSLKRIPTEEGVKEKAVDTEEKYTRLIMEYRELKNELEELKEKNRLQLASMRGSLELKQHSADTKRMQLMDQKLIIAMDKTKYSRTGKPIPQKKIEELHRAEMDKFQKVRTIRIQNFELKNSKQAIDQSIREKEEFSKGLHLIHYEQLKMENSSLSEKIEEKNESLQKAQLKSINAVHVWAHTREKLQFEQNQDAAMEKRLGELESEIEQYKKDLNMIKNDSDKMKQDTMSMRNAAPLVTNAPLLMDYETRKNELAEKKRMLQHLKNRHKEHITRIKQLEQRLAGVVRQFDHTLGGGTSNRRTMRSTGGTMAHQDALTSKSAGGTGTQPNHQQQRNARATATATTHDNGNSGDNKLPDIYKRVGSASPSATTRQVSNPVSPQHQQHQQQQSPAKQEQPQEQEQEVESVTVNTAPSEKEAIT